MTRFWTWVVEMAASASIFLNNMVARALALIIPPSALNVPDSLAMRTAHFMSVTSTTSRT